MDSKYKFEEYSWRPIRDEKTERVIGVWDTFYLRKFVVDYNEAMESLPVILENINYIRSLYTEGGRVILNGNIADDTINFNIQSFPLFAPRSIYAIYAILPNGLFAKIAENVVTRVPSDYELEEEEDPEVGTPPIANELLGGHTRRRSKRHTKY